MSTDKEQVLPVGILQVDTTIQRDLDPSWVRFLTSNYSENSVRQPVVSKRPDGFFIVDGQHTVQMLREMFGDKYAIRCDVRYGLSKSEETRMFQDLNRNRKKPSISILFRNDLSLGDPIAVACAKAAADNGLVIGGTNTIWGISAIAGILATQRHTDQAGLTRVLRILRAAQHGQPGCYAREILLALSLLVADCPQFDDEQMTKAIAREGCQKFLRMSKQRFPDHGNSAYRPVAYLIGEAYDKGLSARNKIKPLKWVLERGV